MKKVFIEIGAGIAGELSFMGLPNWRTKEEELNHKLPEALWKIEGQWEGYMIEPIPENFVKLTEYHKAFDIQQITRILGAVAGRSNFQRIVSYSLLEDAPHNMGSLVEPSRSFFDQVRKPDYNFCLKTFTLDELLDWIGAVPTVLRMDVESSERDIFETFSWSCRPCHWQIDHHNYNVQWFVDMFEGKGYKVLGTNMGTDNMEIWAFTHG